MPAVLGRKERQSRVGAKGRTIVDLERYQRIVFCADDKRWNPDCIKESDGGLCRIVIARISKSK